MIKLNCGCEFAEQDGKPILDFNNINLKCPRTYQLFQDGYTKGVFQLESPLGRTWCKKVKPETIEQIADVISIIRPGTLQAKSDGKSLTQHYVDRKFGREETKSTHPKLTEILAKTYCILIFQEDSMRIAKELAGFNLQEADDLRKSIGRKDSKLMASLREKFLEGCKKINILNEEQAKEVFDWIRASQRYSFNKCLTGDTVVTTTGYANTTIQDIKVGDYVNSPNGFVKVLHKYNNGSQKVYKFITTNNKSIRCTLNHKFLCTDNKKHQILDILLNHYSLICQDGVEHIQNIECGTEEITYDIEVDHPSHIYFANGIATSNSHAISYAITAYISAYCKVHFPLEFFTSYLKYADDKQDTLTERKDLVEDAKNFNIEVRSPSLLNKSHGIHISGPNTISFGISNVKSIGTSVLNKILSYIQHIEHTLSKPISKWTWIEYLKYFSDNIPTPANTNLILVGGMDFFCKQRREMVFEFETWNKLTDREKEYTKKNTTSTLMEDLQLLLGNGCKTKNRREIVSSLITSLESPPISLRDTADWIAWNEEKLLGVALTCNKVDGCDGGVNATHTCKSVFETNPKYSIVAVQIVRQKEVVTKKGKNPGQKMAFLDISDGTFTLEGVPCFPESWKEYKYILQIENTVCVSLNKLQQGFCIHKAWQI